MDIENTTPEISWDDATAGFYGDDITPTEAPETHEDPEMEENSPSEENTPETPTETPQSDNEGEQNVEEPTPQPAEQPQPTDFSRDFIANQREYAQELTAIKQELWQKVEFSEQIVAGDEVITDYKQLTAYENPRTGEAFTEEEAAAWFMDQSRKKAEEKLAYEKDIERVAEINLDLKTGAFEVNKRYGEFLNAHPELKAEIYQEFQKTLSMNHTGEIVIGMPIDIVKFYDFQLKPYMKIAELEKQNAEYRNTAEKAEAERQKTINHTDRGDILRGSQKTTPNADGDEWSQALDDYYSKGY